MIPLRRHSSTLNLSCIRNAGLSERHRLSLKHLRPPMQKRVRKTPTRTPSRVKAVATAPEILKEFSKKSVGEDLDPSYDKTFPEVDNPRRVGILLHPTSLPGR